MLEIRLLVREPDQDERTVTLAAGATVGRAEGNGLTLNDPAASRTHLKFGREGGSWFVEDLGSSSGTLVDGGTPLRKGQRSVLRHGSLVTVGDTTIEVGIEGETQDGTIPNLRAGIEEPPPEVELTVPVAFPFAPGRKPSARPAESPARPAPVEDAAVAEDQPSPPAEHEPAVASDREPEATPAREPAGSQATGAADPAAAAGAFGERTRRIETTELEGMRMRPRLLARNARMVLVGPGDRRSVAVEQSPFVIGRAKHAELMLTDDSISTEHARLRFDSDTETFHLEDLGSRNGTFLAGTKLAKSQPATLTLPVWLRFGAVEAFLVDDRSSSAAQEKLDRHACRLLERAGRLTASATRQAADAARPGRRHIGELVLLQTRLSVAEWVDAVSRARAGAGGAGRWVLGVILLVAIGGLAYWLFWRG